MNNNNNPQEVPQVKSVEERKYDGVYAKLVSVMDKAHQKEVTELQSRIAELEKQNAEYRKALEEISEVGCDSRIPSTPKILKINQIAEQASIRMD